MRKFFPTIVASALLVSAAMAQDLPQPGVEGVGTSTQTLSLVKEAVTVTVDSGGSFSTLTGQGDGHLSVDVNGLGVGLGSDGASSPGKSGSAVSPVGLGASAGLGSGGTIGAGPGSTAGEIAVMPNDELTSAIASSCEVGVPLSPEAIGKLAAGTRIVITDSCPSGVMSDAQRQAIAENGMLSHYLESSGLDLANINSVSAFNSYVIIAR